MNIAKLLGKLADNEVGIQGLNGAITSIKSTKQRGIYAVTFHTDAMSPNDLVMDDGKVGVLVFIDRAAFKREMEKEQSAGANHDN